MKCYDGLLSVDFVLFSIVWFSVNPLMPNSVVLFKLFKCIPIIYLVLKMSLFFQNLVQLQSGSIFLY